MKCIFDHSSALTKIYIKLVPFFRKDCHGYISGNIELVPAKIPILKFYDQFGKIEVEAPFEQNHRDGDGNDGA